jgi:hypothetical protein
VTRRTIGAHVSLLTRAATARAKSTGHQRLAPFVACCSARRPVFLWALGPFVVFLGLFPRPSEALVSLRPSSAGPDLILSSPLCQPSLFGTEQDQIPGDTVRIFPGETFRGVLTLSMGCRSDSPSDLSACLARVRFHLTAPWSTRPEPPWDAIKGQEQLRAFWDQWTADNSLPAQFEIQPIPREAWGKCSLAELAVWMSVPEGLEAGEYSLTWDVDCPELAPLWRSRSGDTRLSWVWTIWYGPARNEAEQLYRLWRDAYIATNNSGDLDEGEAKTRALLSLHPLSIEGHILLAAVHYRRGNLREALVEARQALEIMEKGLDTKEYTLTKDPAKRESYHNLKDWIARLERGLAAERQAEGSPQH